MNIKPKEGGCIVGKRLTYNPVIESLEKITYTKRRMNEKLQQLEALKGTYISASAVMNNALPVHSNKSPVESSLTKIQKLENQIKKDMDVYSQRYYAGMQIINKLLIKDSDGHPDLPKTEICKSIIEFRYLEGLPWDKIAEKIKYSIRQTMRLHDTAIKNIQKNLKTKTGTGL